MILKGSQQNSADACIIWLKLLSVVHRLHKVYCLLSLKETDFLHFSLMRIVKAK